MYRSYFLTAIRSLIKNKLHAFINIAGLSVGMAVAIIIALWIRDELSYEKSFDNYDRIARVIQNVTNNGEVDTWYTVPYPLAEELRTNYGSDFSNIVLTSGTNYSLLTADTIKLTKVGLFAEPEFTTVFSLNILQGTANALEDQSTILLSNSTARAYFGESDPIGKVMTIDHQMTVHVGGVYEDIPHNSELSEIDFIAPWMLLYNSTDWIKTMQDPWRPNAFTVYVALADHATFESASERIKDAKLKKVSEALSKKKPELFLHPMRNWHLYSEFKNGKLVGGRIQYVWLFGIVGTFVLLMACINFMNLSTARSEKRAKEVGIRKAVGSLRGQLVTQFFTESILTALLCCLLALLLVQLALPMFNTIASKNMRLPWADPLLWLGGVSFSVIIGFVAGSYPALYLSSIKSIGALKGAFKAGRSASLPRKVLVIVQFTVSVTLIIGTVIVFLQIQHAKNRPIGYKTNGLVAVPIGVTDVHTHFDAIKSELENSELIVNMAESSAPVTEQWSSSSVFDWRGKDPDLSVDFPTCGVSYDYGKTIGWEIISGRDFSRDFKSDTAAMIINEAAARYIGFKNPLEESIVWYQQPYKIIGVIKNIVTRSPYETVGPAIYCLSNERENFLLFKINPAVNASKAIAGIEQAVKKYDTEQPFSYEFTDDAYGRKFDGEERVGKLASIFAGLAIFISCLGIFGLSSFMAEQRTKEIGVRKVHGASQFELWLLMSKDFIALVILSCVIAVPVAYYLLSSWLEGYEYRVSLPWWTFIGATAGTLLITMITVSWHTLHAAALSPAKTLRTE